MSRAVPPRHHLLYGVENFTIPATTFVLVVVAHAHGLTGGEIGLLLRVQRVRPGGLRGSRPLAAGGSRRGRSCWLELYTGLGRRSPTSTCRAC